MSTPFVRFLAPLQLDDVIEKAKRRQLPLQTGKSSHPDPGLMSWDRLREMAINGETLKDLRFYNKRERIPLVIMRSNDAIDLSKVDRLINNGGSIMMQSAHRFDEGLAAIVRDYLEIGGNPVSLAAVGSTGDCGALTRHSDPIDLFVRQIHGSKRWRIYARDDGSASQSSSEALFDITLEEGDYLFLPAHMPHECDTIGGTSLHVTLAFLGPQYDTWA